MMPCERGWNSPPTSGGREPRLDWFTELWWIVFRWPEEEREKARKDINSQANQEKTLQGRARCTAQKDDA